MIPVTGAAAGGAVELREVGTTILAPGRNVWRQPRAEDSGVIVDAADYYRVFYAAAARAKKYILVSGWQFDRGVKLLRGTDAVGYGKDIKLVRFLDRLCDRTPGLRIFMLAWDFHMVFALEREWMQRVWFHYATNERLVFRFDDAEAAGGCHHQKFAVIDGEVAFVGGIDLCEARWDDRAHRSENPLRISRGTPSKPYHDLQAHLIGREPGVALRDLFVDRWRRSGGEALNLDEAAEAAAAVQAPRPWEPLPGLARAIPLGGAPVALSRTDPRGENQTVKEVEQLMLDAIDAADRLLYIETQYFSSTSIRKGLVARMRARGRPRLEIVIVVNERAEALKEEIAVGLRQAKNLERLRQVARDTGHALGVYYSLSDGAGEQQRATYIHSKLLITDDRFLTVGSANLTNRSMGVDSELHVSWEAPPEARRDHHLVRGIRRLRVSLLAEHAGLSGAAAIRPLVAMDGLVGRLDEIAARPGGRLRAHGPPSPGQQRAMKIVDPENLPFDPAKAEYSSNGDDDDDDDSAISTDEEPSDEHLGRVASPVRAALGGVLRRLRD